MAKQIQNHNHANFHSSVVDWQILLVSQRIQAENIQHQQQKHEMTLPQTVNQGKSERRRRMSRDQTVDASSIVRTSARRKDGVLIQTKMTIRRERQPIEKCVEYRSREDDWKNQVKARVDSKSLVASFADPTHNAE